MRLVLATRNAHKLREVGGLLEEHDVVALPDDVELPPETGTTFAENALVKARTAAAGTGEAAIADDSGIESEALGGRPGVYSARFAGEGAGDGENLAKLVAEAPAGSALAYVCALAFVGSDGAEQVFEGRCTGTLDPDVRGDQRLRLRPVLRPRRRRRRTHDGAARPRREGRDQPPRACGAGVRAMAADAELSGAAAAGGGPPAPRGAGKAAAAAVSVASNTFLILLKVAAGTITGSVSILTEALHSLIDLIASIVAFFSVRKADEPADEDHPYGHEKIEHMAAAIEGMLILVGSGVIVFEAVRRLVEGGHVVDQLGFGIGVIALSIAVNLIVSTWLFARARATGSPALEADAEHLRTDMVSSVGVLVGLVLVVITDEEWIDPVVALVVAGWISIAGLRILRQASRVLIDEALPQEELDAICEEVAGFADRGVVGFHALRARRAGNHRYIDMHLQFRAGMSLDDAHRMSHELQDAIAARLGNAEVLFHLEPEHRLRPGQSPLTTRAG